MNLIIVCQDQRRVQIWLQIKYKGVSSVSNLNYIGFRMRYASTYGLECLVLAHQHETFAFQKKRHRRHGIFENFHLEKILKN